jgi:NADH-quinone oxidoreductase subunit H
MPKEISAQDILTPRRKLDFQGVERSAANLGVKCYAFAAPIVKRFPALIFFGAVISVSAGLIAGWKVLEFVDAQTAAREPVPSLLQPLANELVRDFIALGVMLGFLSVLPMYAIWWERKVAGRIQSRLGPMRVGGWHGWAQSLADGIKLVNKEDLIPEDSDRPLFRLAAYFAMVPAVCAFLALPFGAAWVFRDLDVALIFILAMLGVEVLGVILAGWASNNKWSLYGAMREACQLVSYEIPMGLSVLVPVLMAENLKMTAIGAQQAGGFWNWTAFGSPFSFLAAGVYFVSSLASCKRAPFDLPEGESELVAGFHTEYSGIRWSFFFFAEYAAMFVVAGLFVILFLGGWHLGLPIGRLIGDGIGPFTAAEIESNALWFIVKSMLIVYLQIWLRWTLPRMRIDQVLYSCIKVMLPLALINIVGAMFWELFRTDAHPTFQIIAYVVQLVLALIFVVIVASILLTVASARRNARSLVGNLAVRHLPGS